MTPIPFLLAAALFAGPLPAAKIDFHAEAGDGSATQVRALAQAGVSRVEHFFGAPFPRTIDFRLASNRAAFDAAFPPELGMGKSECWMVGMGIAGRMVLLSPSDWKAEACDHDPADAQELRRLIAHELTHVYHGQNNAHGDFAGEDDLAWFIEGVAVLAAGQLSEVRIAAVGAAIAAGTAPQRLDDVWAGKLKYGFAGSLVAYVDRRWGRTTMRRLLAATSTAQALSILGTDETSLLADWRKAAAG